MHWLAPAASAPQYESLANDYLHIPYPDGDYVQNIEERFEYHTRKARQLIHTHIPGMADPLPRREMAWIEEQLEQGKSVVLTGDAGTGKSGIAAQLTDSAQASGLTVLLFDARRVGSCQDEAQIHQHLGLNGPVASAIRRMGSYKGCRVILDQLDSAVGTPAARLLLELATDVSGHKGVQFVVVSRKSEKHEQRMTHELSEAGFTELTSHPLGESDAQEVLSNLGLPNPTPELVAMACNLLNLELIGEIKNNQPNMDFSRLTDEVDLWDLYFGTLQDREEKGAGLESAESILAEARRLAWVGLSSEEGIFCLEDPMLYCQRRLASWGIIEREDGQVYRFRHERLQDFLCAWDAVEKLWMPGPVVAKVGAHRSAHVLTWMDKLYYRRNPTRRKQFLKEVYNV